MRKSKIITYFFLNALKGFYFRLNVRKTASTLATFSNRLLKIYLELKRLIEMKYALSCGTEEGQNNGITAYLSLALCLSIRVKLYFIETSVICVL